MKTMITMVCLCLFAGSAFAAPAPKMAPETQTYGAYLQAVTGHKPEGLQAISVLSENEIKAGTKALLERGKRAPASATVASLSGDENLIAFVNSINSLKSSEELDEKIRQMDLNYDKLPKNLQFYAALLVPMRTLRGVAWRMIPMFPNSRVLHSMTLSAFQRLMAAQKVYFPTSEWEALAAYMTEPYVVYKNDDPTKEGALAKQFKSEADLQILSAEFYGALYKSAARLQRLELSDESPVLFDKKMVYGASSFRDSIDRYRLVGGLEKEMLLTGLHTAMSRLAGARAYSNYGVLNLSQGLGELYGLNRILSIDASRIEGASAADRASALRRTPHYDQLMPDGKDWMKRSFQHLAAAVGHYKIFFGAMKRTEVGSRDGAYMLDLNFFKGGDREMDAAMVYIDRMLAGRTTILSHVTGESVEVDVPGFYNDPPADLKSMLAVADGGFEEGPSWLSKKLTVNGKTTAISYRNYTKGRPIRWDSKAYSKLFPQLKPEGTTDKISTFSRVLAQSWGGTPINSFLLDYLQ